MDVNRPAGQCCAADVLLVLAGALGLSISRQSRRLGGAAAGRTEPVAAYVTRRKNRGHYFCAHGLRLDIAAATGELERAAFVGYEHSGIFGGAVVFATGWKPQR